MRYCIAEMPRMRAVNWRDIPAHATNAAAYAAEIFATRIARKRYGKRGYCRVLRATAWAPNWHLVEYEAFIGRDLPDREGGGCQGGNVRFTVVRS